MYSSTGYSHGMKMGAHTSESMTRVLRRMAGQGEPGVLIVVGEDGSGKRSFLDWIKDFTTTGKLWHNFYWPEECQRLASLLPRGSLMPIPVGKPKAAGSRLLAAVISVAVVRTLMAEGLKKGRKVVVLCDDLEEFLQRPHREVVLANKAFFQEFSGLLETETSLTFVGTCASAELVSSFASWEQVLKLGPD
jgi:hypothetical protein